MTETFQQRVQPWMHTCFGEAVSADITERNHRFLEEALELVQEVGGVMVTLAALFSAVGLDMNQAGETELARVWTKVEAIRAKQAAKPKHSPLPGS